MIKQARSIDTPGLESKRIPLIAGSLCFCLSGCSCTTPIVAGIGNFFIGLSGNAVLADYEIVPFFLI